MTDALDDPAQQEAIRAQLAALRAQGAAQADPARFRHMEVLARRLQDQPIAVRRILQARLQAALADCTAQGAPPPPAAARAETAGALPPMPDAGSPLAALNRYIGRITQPDASALPAQAGASPAIQMKSVRRFGQTWSRISAEAQVDQALGRGPQNAGPLNSHRLMLRSLALMRALSPDYLRRFLAHADTLLWLEQVNQKYMLGDGRSPRRSRARK